MTDRPSPSPEPIPTAHLPHPFNEERALAASDGSGENPIVLEARAREVQDRLVRNMLEFHDPLAFAEALGLTDFSIREEVELLVGIARVGTNAERLAAIKALRSMAADIMRNSGMIEESRLVTKIADGSGNTIEGERSVRSITADSRRLLEAAQRGHPTKEVTNASEETATNRLERYVKRPDDPNAPGGLCAVRPAPTADPPAGTEAGAG